MLRILSLALCLTIISVMHAQAQDFCGEVINLREMGEAEKYCSVYDRQLAYREERLEFRKQLEERREDFIAPQLEAKKKYKKDLEALHGERSRDEDFYGR